MHPSFPHTRAVHVDSLQWVQSYGSWNTGVNESRWNCGLRGEGPGHVQHKLKAQAPAPPQGRGREWGSLKKGKRKHPEGKVRVSGLE